MTTEEMLLQLIEGQKRTTEELSGFKEELSSFKNEVNSRFDRMDDRLDSVENRLDRMDERFDRIEERLDNVEDDVKSIKLTLEHDIEKPITLLLEMQLSNSERFQALEKDVQEIKDTLAINEVIQGLKENKLI